MSFVGKNDKNPSHTIPASGFYPEILVDDFRSRMRVLDSVANEQCEHVLIQSLLFVTNGLKPFEHTQNDKGILKLIDVPGQDIAGKSEHVRRYEIALFSYAKALLQQRYRDTDLTRLAGANKADAIEPSIDDHIADAIGAIREMNGHTSTYAKLI